MSSLQVLLVVDQGRVPIQVPFQAKDAEPQTATEIRLYPLGRGDLGSLLDEPVVGADLDTALNRFSTSLHHWLRTASPPGPSTPPPTSRLIPTCSRATSSSRRPRPSTTSESSPTPSRSLVLHGQTTSQTPAHGGRCSAKALTVCLLNGWTSTLHRSLTSAKRESSHDYVGVI